MKIKSHSRVILLCLVMLSTLLVRAIPVQAASSQTDPTATVTLIPSDSSTTRPLILIDSYTPDTDKIKPGQDFSVHIVFRNNGQSNAYNIQAALTPGDVIPRSAGGTLFRQQLIPGEGWGVDPALTISSTVAPGSVVNMVVTVTYSDQSSGALYSGSFNLAFRITTPKYVPPAPTTTPTVLVVKRPQLAISAYTTDVDPLQPGMTFSLSLDVRNLGNEDAKGVTMIMGGGNAATGGGSGTPEPGGVSGSSGEFTNFAPVKSSNIQYMGDIHQDYVIKAKQNLIVNVSTNPGAYPVKFSFSYVDSKGVRYTDDQVITLLVYSLPLVEINFYHDPGSFVVGQPGQLPIQISNLSRKSVVLGNMKATSKNAKVTNNVTLVGPMDPGGYFPLDATVIPEQPGQLEIDISVSYTDDFNQLKVINQTLTVDVQDRSSGEIIGTPGPGGNVKPGDKGGGTSVDVNTTPETLIQKIGRFIKGLLGLGSGQDQPGGTSPAAPVAEPTPGSQNPIVIPPGGKG